MFHFPWMFRRDEIDVLEDEIDVLYAAHERAPHDDDVCIEGDVLREMADTEEQSHADVALRLALRGLDPAMVGHDHGESMDEGLQDHDGEHIRAHPLYQYARLWAQALREVTLCGYETSSLGKRDFFRVYANANLVPIKVFIALSEGGQDDVRGFEVASEAYQLAATYTGRINESLDALRRVEVFASYVGRLRARGETLAKAIEAQREILKRRGI